jgi:hypothetical protein
MCKVSGEQPYLRVDLMESSKYISLVRQKNQGDILYIDIYTTTIYNWFENKKQTSIEVHDIEKFKEIIIVDRRFSTDSILKCNDGR